MEFGEVFGVELPAQTEIAFIDTVFYKFYKGNLPIGATYQIVTGFDYSTAINRLKDL